MISKLKLLVLSVALIGSTSLTAKTIEKVSTLNSPNLTGNVTVIPMDNLVEMSKFKLSYSPVNQVLNDDYSKALHVIQRLSIGDQTKINMFMHNSRIEQELTPKTIPSGGATLLQIVEKSPYDTSKIVTVEDYRDFARHGFTQKLNQFVPIEVLLKNKNQLNLKVTNRTDFFLRSFTANVRIIDEATGRVYVDEMITEKVSLKPMYEGEFPVYLASRLDNWVNINDGLVYKIVVTEITYDGLNGNKKVFNADDFYKKAVNPNK